MIFCYILLLVVCNTNNAAVKRVSLEEKTSLYWLKEGEHDINRELLQQNIIKKAKNVILFIGDGMGPSTISAARNYKNQQMVSEKSPDIGIFFENFPNTALMKTHSTDDYVADSSSTATAMITGIKTNSGVVSVSPEVMYNNCSSHSEKEHDLESIATMFYKQGKSVGVVTTARITHATPSVLYAHSASRDWEASVPEDCKKKDIAYQLIEKSKIFNVILGGGLSYFVPESEGGKRKDNVNLIKKWKSYMKEFQSRFVSNLRDFRNTDLRNTEYLFGLLSNDHMDYEAFRSNQPSLEEMTQTAIRMLSKNKNGFFLMVEGGRIDHAHHASKAKLAILETLELEKAVEMAYWLTNINETLISVTADHSHVFTIGSYAKRENDITKKNKAIHGHEIDNKGHTSLLYSNGPGYRTPREDISDQTSFKPDFVYNSGVPLRYETHGGEEVAIYSQGPWAHLFNGVHHQSYVGHVMMFASCCGPYIDQQHCSNIQLKQRLLIAEILVLTTILYRISFSI